MSLSRRLIKYITTLSQFKVLIRLVFVIFFAYCISIFKEFPISYFKYNIRKNYNDPFQKGFQFKTESLLLFHISHFFQIKPRIFWNIILISICCLFTKINTCLRWVCFHYTSCCKLYLIPCT